MAKKIKKKTKIKLIPIIIFILLLLIVGFLVSFFLNIKIKNIYVYDNNILSDQEIIELSGISNYPSFIKTSSLNIKKELNKNVYIKDVKVKKKLLATIEIYIDEYELLFEKASDGMIVTSSSIELEKNSLVVMLPILLNYVPDTVYSDFIEEFGALDKNIRNKISHIEYKPNDYDKQRFLLYMSDGNSVYTTITRFELVNKYDEIYPSLGGKKGILYLDSGNHFEIKK